MKNEQDIQRRVEETLAALDGLQRAEAPPFLYTKLQARLSKSPVRFPRLFKPALAALVLVTGFQLFFVLQQNKPISRTEQLDGLIRVYEMNSTGAMNF